MPALPITKKIRLLIVDDSIFFRQALEKGFSSDPRIEVVGTAVDAMDAMDKIKAIRPDVVTLDVEMPKLNGIDFLKKLMPVHPVPVVVVSSAPIRVLDALGAGAVDFVRKPEIKGPDGMKSFMSELIVKVKIASTARVGKKPSPPLAPAFKAPQSLTLSGPAQKDIVIAIGASTGGTEAILEVVKDLPATTPGIVIVQHMPPVFTNMYAQRLDRICKMSVKEAAHGDRVETGKIIIGAGEFHLRLAKDSRGYYVRSEPGAKVSGHCPSVDVLFDSVAAVAKQNAMGIELTGMGADGANGLLKMRQAGAYTVGQDKETCVVYGMPMVAFNIGAVQKQLPLGEIGSEIIRYLNTRR
ncbi:MAG: chemotaxis response regulator protein-glutamate methylesterase [Oscillospiraceae bacterium]|nr:chemotaxis response regulator protein-glutamate methylesterase [Oscillospiraceae bacterium]